ncbi:hypothetical protein JOF48_001072 [Arthrobacter stackebrandtii]|uniref:Uncharacterized protein n=1 Tax=Arthrobacter stackebrandtii TaxID=272161 RepID=A0ABS4YWD7_9MICC|nr:hypothetical protein [Arthrobacter stackebrandtii]MBP2412273.1 hypothetical protein [Arthrobacter stackebrandtii]
MTKELEKEKRKVAMTDEERKSGSETPASTAAPPGKVVPPATGKPVPPKGSAAPKESPGPKGSAAKKSGAAPKSAPAKKPAAGSKRRWKSKVLAGGLAAVALFGGGTFLGTTLPDPATSDAYVQLASEKSSVEQDLENSRVSFRKLDEKYADLQGTLKARDDDATARESAVAGAEKKVAEAEAAVKKREEAVAGAEAVKAKNTFGDGTRTVGRDIEPGSYIPTADVGSSCYWAILTTGTNGSDIVDNDLPGGGRPSVTLSEGQDFKSSRCGSWTKQ